MATLTGIGVVGSTTEAKPEEGWHASPGEQCRHGAWQAAAPDLPPAFMEVLTELGRFEGALGGVKNFRGRPRIEKKVKACEFRQSYSDFEYVYLTVLGLAELQKLGEDIVRRNNGRVFKDNPGVQLLERQTGMTMHGEREGANHLLRAAPEILIEAFAVSRRDRGGTLAFFREAFDRTADPCLEGRAGRILEYLAARKAGGGADGTPPVEDLSVQPLPATAPPADVAGEHLRVFVNECTWAWARSRGVDYPTAKAQRDADADAAAFSRLCNARMFEASMLTRGIVSDVEARQWEVEIDGGGWSPYGEDANECMELARFQGLARCQVKVRSWTYEIDLRQLVQLNPSTNKERKIRHVESPERRRGLLTHVDLKAAIAYFVDLQTLPSEPVLPDDKRALEGTCLS